MKLAPRKLPESPLERSQIEALASEFKIMILASPEGGVDHQSFDLHDEVARPFTPMTITSEGRYFTLSELRRKVIAAIQVQAKAA